MSPSNVSASTILVLTRLASGLRDPLERLDAVGLPLARRRRETSEQDFRSDVRGVLRERVLCRHFGALRVAGGVRCSRRTKGRARAFFDGSDGFPRRKRRRRVAAAELELGGQDERVDVARVRVDETLHQRARALRRIFEDAARGSCVVEVGDLGRPARVRSRAPGRGRAPLARCRSEARAGCRGNAR